MANFNTLSNQKISTHHDENLHEKKRRHPYVTPHLKILGDIRDLTLGGSPGTGDSGDPLSLKP